LNKVKCKYLCSLKHSQFKKTNLHSFQSYLARGILIRKLNELGFFSNSNTNWVSNIFKRNPSISWLFIILFSLIMSLYSPDFNKSNIWVLNHLLTFFLFDLFGRVAYGQQGPFVKNLIFLFFVLNILSFVNKITVGCPGFGCSLFFEADLCLDYQLCIVYFCIIIQFWLNYFIH
jgi:hypothetical protein